MITKVLPLQFIKKSPFYGSYKGMRYALRKKEEALEVCVYPEPYAFDATPEENKKYVAFEFSDDGYEKALDFLNHEYETGQWK